MDEPCDICGATGTFETYVELSLVGAFDAVVAHCTGCRFRQIRPRLTRAELAACYPMDYFDSATTIGFADYAKQQQRQERVGYELARELRRLAPRGRVLEIGCALGFLLDVLRRRTEWHVAGIDVSEFAVHFARKRFNLDVRLATLEEATFPSASFDFVIQKDVLEHVTHPRQHLEEVCRVLRPGGLTWIVTPNGEANLRPLHDMAASGALAARGELPLLDQGHLSFFTRSNLLRLFEECGFDCLRMNSIGLKRGLRALGFLPRKKRKQKSAPSGQPRGPRNPPETGAAARLTTAAELEALFERIEAEMKRSRKRGRDHRAYFRFRTLVGRFDTLPGALPWGIDFDILLRKRARPAAR